MTRMTGHTRALLHSSCRSWQRLQLPLVLTACRCHAAATGRGVLQGYSLRSIMAVEQQQQQQQPGLRLRAEEEAGVPSVAGPLLASGKVGTCRGQLSRLLRLKR